MRHFTVIADFNVTQYKIYHGDLPFLCLVYSSICHLYNCQKLWFCNGICNFSNILLIKDLKTQWHFRKNSMVRFLFLLLDILTFDQHMLFFQIFLMDFH